VLLPDTPLVQANLIAQRLRASIMESAAAATRNPDVKAITSSFGLAAIAQGITSVEALIEAADSALYLSKKNGRNRVTLWENTFAVADDVEEAKPLETMP